jgi:hypothetical protein
VHKRRAWKRGKSSTVTFEPKIGDINRFQLDSTAGKNLIAELPATMLIISLEEGKLL